MQNSHFLPQDGQKLKVLLVVILISLCQSRSSHQDSWSANGSNHYHREISNFAQLYKPESAVGIRYKKQIFNRRDLNMISFQSHMLESAFKKSHYLEMFSLDEDDYFEEDYSLWQDCPNPLYLKVCPYQNSFKSQANTNQDSKCKYDEMQQLYLSTNFFKPKNLFIQNPFRNESLIHGVIQIDTVKELKDFSRDNSYLNFALNIKNSYEISVSELEDMEVESVIEGFLFKKAKQHNIENFKELQSVLGPERLQSVEMFQKYAFTYEDPDYIANMTNGMRPIMIQNLKPSSSVYRYFSSEIDISPSKISFDECELLIAKMAVLRIENKQRRKDIEIKAIITSTPELTIIPPDAVEFPYKLKSNEFIEISIVYTPETQGHFEALMYVVVDEWVFISSLNAFVISNNYDLEPIYFTDVTVGEKMEFPLFITNPLPHKELIIEELHSTMPEVQLKWPNGQVISDKVELKSPDDSLIQYLKIPALQRKHLVNLVFGGVQVKEDICAIIHILTSLGQVIRVPIYYHVHSDIMKFTPTVLDFGLAPLNFDMLKLPVRAKSKSQEPLIIQDILVPIHDNRLDFLIIEAKSLTNEQKVIRRNQEIFLGYALLKPSRPGMVQSKIIIQAIGQASNKTYSIELPIVGKVASDSAVFGVQQSAMAMNKNSSDAASNASYPLPLISFDISDYVINTPFNRVLFTIPTFKPVILQAPLLLKNTFKVPITIRGVLNMNNEVRIALLADVDPYQEIILAPGASIKFAQVELLTTALKITQGTKYISVKVNNTMIPVALQIYDRNLLCVWEEEMHQGKARFILCKQGYEITFGTVPVNEPKLRKVNITNFNPMNVTFESVTKSTIDDLIVYVEKLIDKNGAVLPLPSEADHGKFYIMGSRRTKKIINFTLQPYQTMSIVFAILAKEPKLKSSRIDFQTRGKETSDFSFNYSYQVCQGNLTFVPQTIRFNPAYPGMIQLKTLSARSTFDIPILVTQVVSNDVRIFPTLHNNVIMPNNKTEIASLTFDPNKQPITLFKDIDLQTIFSQFIGNQPFDPHRQQSMMHVLNGIVAGPLTQITMITNQGAQFQINTNNINGGGGPSFNQLMKNTITALDIQQYREKQKAWEQLGSMGKTEINSFVTIETNVFQNITVGVKAYLSKPALLCQEEIDYDLVQIGTFQSRNIRIQNPGDETLQFSLFLVTTDMFKQIQENKTLSGNEEEGGDLFSSKAMNSQLNDKEFLFQQYCNSKLKEPSSNDEPKQNTYQNAPNEIQISALQNQKLLCQKLSRVLKSMNNSEEFEYIRANIEPFFKEMQNGDTNQNHLQQQIIKNIIKHSKNQMTNNGGGGPNGKPAFDQQGQFQFNQGATYTPLMPQLFPELENLTAHINQLSQAKLLDSNLLFMPRQSEKHTKGFLSSILELVKSFYRSIFAQGKPSANPKPKERQHSGNTNGNQQKKEQKVLFRLKNPLLHDLIILNDTLKLQSILSEMENPVFSLPPQSFYINPKYQGVVFKVDPKGNLTIQQAVQFQPASIHSEGSQMVLLLKNNLTVLHPVDIKGSGGTGLIEFVKTLKKSKSSDMLVNVHPQFYGFFDYRNDATNSTPDLNSKEVRDRILNAIYGTQASHLIGEDQGNLHFRNTYARQMAEQDRVLQFHITADDILNTPDEFQDTYQFDIYQFDYSTIVNIISDKSSNIKINTLHRRTFVAQNTGNLDIQVLRISIEGRGCSAHGFTIESCTPFTLKPGQQHYINIVYQTDYTIAKVKKSLILETPHFIQEFPIQVTLPANFLPIANSFLPLTSFEETTYLVLKFSILGVGFICFILVSREVLSHFKYKQDQNEQEKLVFQLNQEMQQKVNQPVNKRELPIIRDMIAHDQIYSLYQQAQEKFENQNQLLLKEVSNICQKKNLVCLEAQKQAIEAEKERRMHSRYNNMPMSKYQKEKEEFQQPNKQFIEQQQQQQQQPIQQQQQFIQRQQFTRDQQIALTQSQQRQQAPSPPQIKIFEEQSRLQSPPQNASDEQVDHLISKQEPRSEEKDKDSTLTEFSINDSMTANAPPDSSSQAKEATVLNISSNEPAANEQDQMAAAKQKDYAEKQALKAAQRQQQQQYRLSKKQKKEIAQRQKEQQLAEERFKQLQIQKEQEEQKEQLKLQQQQQQLEENAKRKPPRENSINYNAPREKRQDNQDERDSEKAQEQISIADEPQKDVWVEEEALAQNQSSIFEREHPSNLSQIVQPSLAQEEKAADASKEGIGQEKQEESEEMLDQLEDKEKEKQIEVHQAVAVEEDESNLRLLSMSSDKIEENQQMNYRYQQQQQYQEEEEEENEQYEGEPLQLNQRSSGEPEEVEQQDDQKQQSAQEDDLQQPPYDKKVSTASSQQPQPYSQTGYAYSKKNYRDSNSNTYQSRPYYQQNLSSSSTQLNYRGRTSQQTTQGSGSYYYGNQGAGTLGRRMQGQGYYSQSSGRGQTIQQPYGKRNYYQQSYEDENPHYERRNIPSQSTQLSQQQNQSSTQPYPPSTRRVVINTLRNYPQSSGQGNTRGSRGGRGSYRPQSNDFEEDDYQQHYYGSGGGYNQSSYYRKQYAKDDYDDDYYDSSSYYAKKYTKMPSRKRQYDNYDPNEYVSEEELKKQESQEKKGALMEHNNRSENDSSKYEEKKEKIIRKQQLAPSVNESEDMTPRSEQTRGHLPINELAKDKLSKDDLKPFFESQKNHEEKQQPAAQRSTKNQMGSPNQNSGLTQSLFSFNPLSMISQGSGNHPMQNPTGQRSPREQSPKQHINSVNQLIEHSESEEEKKQQQTSASKQGGTTDFYNAFKSASSLFSKPLFGATVSKTSNAIRQQPQNQHHHHHQSTNEPPMMYNAFQRNTPFYQQNFEEEEDEESNEGIGGSSLFSGSLFDGGIFGGNKNQQSSSGIWSNDQHLRRHQDPQQQCNQYFDDRNQIPFYGYPPGLNIDPREEAQEEESQSLFGNNPTIFNYQQQMSQQPPTHYQRHSQNWSDNQFYEDDEDDIN